MPKIADEIKKARTDFEAAAKKDKDTTDLSAAVKKMSDVEKAAKAWDKSYAEDDGEGARKSNAELATAVKIQVARLNAVMMKLKKDKKDDAFEIGQEVASALLGAGQTANAFTDTLLAKEKHAAAARKMRPTMFSGDWIGAKKDFEAKIGKKKPSKTFLGVVRLSSGLEQATKVLDAASKANNTAAFEKGVKAYKAAMESYSKTVVGEAKVAVAEGDTDVGPENVDPFDYGEAAKDLLHTLNRIRLEAEQALADAKS